MGDWIDIGSVEDFPQGKHQCVTAGDRSIIIFNVDDQFHALLNICPHAGLPLEDGDFTGKVIVCQFHGYAYNVTDGRNIDWPDDEVPAKTYPVRVVEGRVQVDIVVDDNKSSDQEAAVGE
jgi:3-phenylpropionate/trans-cinnamate dioxygenase ferredoxin subunit